MLTKLAVKLEQPVFQALGQLLRGLRGMLVNTT